MSEISENEIKSMTKEQNYMRGYKDGKSDVLDKIRAEMLEEILSHSGTGEEVIQAYADGLKKGVEIIDKYKGESETNNGNDD